MAAGRLPFPGTKFGPCAIPCDHKDCNETQRMSEMICQYCTKEIGYETRFYNEANHGEEMKLCHAACLEEKIDREREATQDKIDTPDSSYATDEPEAYTDADPGL